MKRPYRLLLCGLVLSAIVAFAVISPTVPRSVAAAAAAEAAPAAPGETTAAGNIGGFPAEEITDVALAVEDSGRIHVLWTGKLNPNFSDWAFYSTSTDGSNWTDYEILDRWGSRNPTLAVDNTKKQVHVLYSNHYDGIVERTSVAGNVGTQGQVVAPVSNCLADTDICGGLYDFDLAVNETTGTSHLVWMEGYWYQVDEATSDLRFRAWYAHDDGTGWSAPLKQINDQDTRDLSIETTPNGGTMMAWFQRWAQSVGGATGPGDPIVARTAYGETPGDFPLRQATHDLYPEPERDESILLAGIPGTNSFVLVSDHAMWPGHSLIYRYIWKDGTWSAPLDVAENISGWATPVYVGVADSGQITYIYSNDGILTTRTEKNGTLGAAGTIGSYLAAHGYSGTPRAYFTDGAGDLHLIISGDKNGVPGFYYVKP